MKGRSYINQVERKYNLLFHKKMDVLQQVCFDAACIAAGDVLGLGPDKAVEFRDAVHENVVDIARLTNEDADKDLWELKGKLDRRIKEIVGEENFIPWEERYGEKV